MEVGYSDHGLYCGYDHEKYDDAWVIVDRLSKLAHVILIRVNYLSKRLTNLYMKEIITLQGIPSSIISDQDLRFTSY